MGNRTPIQACLWSALILGCAGAYADDGKTLYNLSDAHEALVDNHGNGYQPLYGTRNLRAVLRGVYYRGGANNAFNRTHRRDNSNPLPDDGLTHLCQEGFTQSVYLYPTNYNTARHEVACKKADGTDNKLDYAQISVLHASREKLNTLLGMIYQHAKNPNMGLIYDHCWNGWHASGITAAYTLVQLCGFSQEQAVRYWNLNTDGNDGKGYEWIRDKIRAFTRFDGMDLTTAEKATYCPNPVTLKFE